MSNNKNFTIKNGLTVGTTEVIDSGGDWTGAPPPLYIPGTGSTAGTWLGTIPNVTAYYEGLSFSYKIPVAGASTTTLNINGLGAQTLYFYGTSKVTTHYPAGSVINLSWSPDNGGCFYAQMFYDSTDDYRIRWQNNITAGVLIHGYQLLLEGADGKYYPVTEGGNNSTTNTVSTAEFKIGGNMLWYDAATDIAANTAGGAYSLFQAYYSGSMEFWSNRSTTAWATINMPVYLVGTINANGNFVLDNSSYTSFLTQTLPTTDDGKVYIEIGLMGNTSDTLRLDINHPIYWFKDGSLKLFSNYALEAEKLATARTINGVSFDGTANITVYDSTKAPLASPALTGTPTAPTATAGTNTTQIATTAFVSTAVSNLVDAAPGTLDTLNELAAALGDDPDFATTVTNSIATKAPLASPTFTGTATAPVYSATTRILTDEWRTLGGNGIKINAGESASYETWNLASEQIFMAAEGGVRIAASGDNWGSGWAGRREINLDYNGITYNGQTVFHDGYHPNADKWTTARTLSLAGDATGSVSFDGSANVTLTAAVVDDSHSHSFNNLLNKTSGTGTYTTSGDFRAPIFYDSNNTTYYVDPSSGNLSMLIAGRIEGGFGAYSTSGTLDWNDTSNVRSGSTGALLLGTATNGMGGSNYYHPFNFEYSSKDGSGNVTQMAIAYGSPGNKLWMRGRYSGSWSSWVEFLNTGTDSQTKSGILQSDSSLRAPIFYDSNNTSYYVDPASTSLLNTLTLAGSTHYIATDKLLLQHDGSHGYIRSMNAGSNLYLGGSNQNTVRLDTGNYLFSQGSVRSPVFYDSDNTAYYLDPANTGTALNLAGDIIGTRLYTGTTAARVKVSPWSSSTYGMGMQSGYTFGGLNNDYAITFQMSDNSSRGFWWGDSTHTNAQGAMALTTDGKLVVASSIAVGAGEATTSTASYALHATGTGYATSDFRAPIFYDSDNTSYYVNPTTASRLSSLVIGDADLYLYESATNSFTVRTGPSTGYFYTTFDASGNATFPGTVSSPTFNATSTTNGGFQGIDADTVSLPSFTWTGDLNTGMYRYGADIVGIAAGGNDEFRVYTTYTLSPGSSRAPIFYDSSNTAYYTDPASTSNLNGLTVAATITGSISGNAGTATKVNSQGDYSATAPGTTRGSAGLNMYSVYNNGYPTTYGNLIHMFGAGGGQLLIGWSGTDGAHADNYVRSKRDNDAGAWSGWAKLWTDANLTNLNQLTNGPGYITSSSSITGSSASCTGNAATATKLATARTIGLSGDASGSVSFDGSANATISVVIADDSHAHAFNNLTGKTGGTGTYTTSGDFRAPIFYDSNNTGYYVDPASTSVINGLNVANSTPVYSSSSFQYHQYQSPHVAYVKKTGGYSWYWRRNDTGLAGGANEVEDMSLTEGGDLNARVSVRAPIFYDSNNTSYYVNQNGESVLSTLTLMGELNLSAATTYIDHTGTIYFRNQSGYATSATLTTGGDFTASGNVTAYSDARLKDNIETINDAIDLVSAMRGVTYTRKDTGSEGIGVIAQEMLEVIPQVVQQSEDGTLSVAYGNLVGVLIEAIKEQQSQITALEAKVEAILAKLK